MRDGKIKTLMRKDRGRNYTTIGCGIFAIFYSHLLVSNPKEILLGENGPFGILLLFIFSIVGVFGLWRALRSHFKQVGLDSEEEKYTYLYNKYKQRRKKKMMLRSELRVGQRKLKYVQLIPAVNGRLKKVLICPIGINRTRLLY